MYNSDFEYGNLNCVSRNIGPCGSYTNFLSPMYSITVCSSRWTLASYILWGLQVLQCVTTTHSPGAVY